MSQRRLQVILDIDTGRGTARLTEAGRSMRDFGLDTQRAGANIRSMGSSFDNLHNGMQRPLQRLRDYVLILGNLRFALMNVRDLAVGWVTGLVKQSAELERLTVLMKGFSKSTNEVGRNEDAQRNLREIMSLANRTGFEMNAMTNAFVKFQSADLNPQVYSLRGLTQAVAKFGGDSDTLHRAAIAIQQMAGKGVISMEELRQQLGEAVPTALKTLAASLGMTVQVLVKEISKGHVAAKPALELMLRDMEITSAGAGERIANTMFGQLAQVRTGLMMLSADFTQLGTEGGFFSNLVGQLKELNATLRSPEARQAVQQFGTTIDHFASSIFGALKTIVEWRSEIGGLVMIVGKAWLMFKAFEVGTWFARMAQQAIVALSSTRREMTGVTGDMARWGDQLKTSIDNQRLATDRWVQKTQQRVQAAQQTIASTRNEIQVLRDLTTTYQQNISILTQQRAQQVASLRTAQTLNAANVAMGRDTVASEAAVKSQQDAVNSSTKALIAQRRLLTQTDEQLVVAEEQLALAFTEETVATARATAATELNATATGIMATTARLAGASVAALGEFMNVALGPIGLFIIACQQLSSWLNADRVSTEDATEAMRQYVGMMANVEGIKKAQSRLNDVNTSLGEGPDAHWYNRNMSWISPGAETKLKAEQKELQDYIAKQSGNAYSNLGRQQAEQLAYERQNYRDRINAASGFRKDFAQAQQDVLNGVKGAGDRLNALRDGQLAKEKTWLNQRIGGQQKLLDGLQENPTQNTTRIAAAQARLAGLQEQMVTLGQSGASSANLITDALNGKGNSTSGAAAAAAKRVGNLQGAVAGLQAQLAGDKSTALQKFMGALAGGAYAGKSDQEISLLRRKAALQDAVADSKRAEAQEEQYANSIGRVIGRVAELNVEMTGAHGNVAKFNAELAAGMHKNWSTEQIEKYRAALQSLDETQSGVDADKVFDRISKEITKASTSADELWKSYTNGTIDADKKTDELRGRFMSLLEGIQLAPEAMAAFKLKVDEAVNKLKEADGILNADRMRKDAKKIEVSLIGDDNARRKAELQRELDDERATVDQQLDAITGDTAEAVKKRLLIEQAFFVWKKAKEAQAAREQEGAILKQAREWYKLGANIQGALAGALSSFTDQLTDGSFKFGKFAEDIVKSLFKIILQATIAYGILSALGMTNGQSFTSFMKQGVSQGVSVGTHHTGGMIGQASSFKTVSAGLFENAFKYHGGGMISKLGPKEVPMIGLEGERVLTQDQQKELANPREPKVTVNVINNGSDQMDADVSTHFNGEEMIVSVVLDRLQKQGRLRDTVHAIARG